MTYSIDYTSRDFESLKSDLIALIGNRTTASTGYTWDPTDYSDLGNVLIETFSYMGDIMSNYIDRVANETTIDTATQLDTLLNFANLVDYKPSGPTPASINITFTNNSVNSIDIPVGTQVMAPLSYGPYNQVYFETTGSYTGLSSGASTTLAALEGKTVNTDRPDLIDPTYNKALPVSLGNSDGTTNQSYLVLDANIIDNSLSVYVGQSSSFTSWTYVDSLLEWGSFDNVFTTSKNTDGTTAIIFGDGVNGAIPENSQLISATYKVSVGAAGNIKSNSITELTFVPGNLDPQVITYLGVSNSLAAIGGADADNTAQLKTKIKAALFTRGRAVTLTDYANLALMVSQVGKAKATASVYSSVYLYIQPQNDNTATPGYPSATLVSTTSAAVSTGSVITYTTTSAHGFAVGDKVSISGLTPVGYNLSNATIATTPTSTTFTVSNALTAGNNSSTIGGTVIDLTPTANFSTLIQTSPTLGTLAQYMSDKIPAGVSLTYLPPTYVPIYLTINITIKSTYKKSDAKLAVYQAMLGAGGLFYYDNNTFGDAITLASITNYAYNASSAITNVNITQLNINNGSTAADITLTSDQIPFLTSTALIINTTGGI